MGSAVSQSSQTSVRTKRKRPKQRRKKDLQKTLEEIYGDILTKEEITQYYNLYSSPKLIEECFFDFETLYEKLLDENGEVRKLKVNLAVINIQKWTESKLKTMVVSNVLRVKEGETLGFGLVHVAVLLGQHIVHWFDDGLVHLTPIKSANPNVAIELGELDIEEKCDQDKIKQFCYVISEYNTKMVYNNRSCNCHHFVRDCINALDLEFSSIMKGQLGSYLRRVRNGKLINEREFKNPITSEKIVFTSHRHLDEYVSHLLSKHPKFKEEHPYDYRLLKAFDRGYWMGHLRDRHENAKPENEDATPVWNEMFLPLFRVDPTMHTHGGNDKKMVEFELDEIDNDHSKREHYYSVVACPFGDPAHTGCFLPLD
ncbi:hypothetical protein C9374_005263 [Naegleria lovaniensis]|uniref:Uncharacterized protein n=1 Tax=Naegleria lovaniensis TaxID=51637 RepID=A0AA88KK87_NAELO|nr:uncharacterized protein C9374_005263 [Naegleria lovaniensis]KAG2382683.1 hypothetical protein C9374_005263 [Naegleria lovaniensis]